MTALNDNQRDQQEQLRELPLAVLERLRDDTADSAAWARSRGYHHVADALGHDLAACDAVLRERWRAMADARTIDECAARAEDDPIENWLWGPDDRADAGGAP